MIEHRPGQIYLIRNYVTRAGSYFECREVIERNGHKILYGDIRGYGIRIAKGSFDFGGRPAAFAVPNLNAGKAGLAAMAMVIKEAGGDNGTGRAFGVLRLSELLAGADASTQAVKGPPVGQEEEPVMAISKALAELWGGTPWKETHHTSCGGWGVAPGCNQLHTPNRDGLVASCAKALELFDDIMATGALPTWFRDARNVARMRK